MATYNLSLPLYLMAKPVGSRCNLHCDYCYYLLSAEKRATRATTMSDEVLEQYVRRYIEIHPEGEVVFCWHGGEPLLQSRAFYEKALRLQARYAANHRILNTIQTNGTLLSDDWCRFLKEHQFLVGISIDGPEHLHDYYRRHASGEGSFRETMQAVERMNHIGVEYNILAVINRQTAQHPLEVYRFLRGLGTPFLQFSPNVERLPNGMLTASTVDALDFGHFYNAIFDEWFSRDIGRTYVQLFDATLAALMHQPSGVCLFGERCAHAAVMEADGTVYCCDHFATEDYRLGNLMTSTLHDLMFSDQMMQFRNLKTSLAEDCQHCPYLELCYGECPKNRFPMRADELPPYRNYLCPGYKLYFEHTMPTYRHMAKVIL